MLDKSLHNLQFSLSDIDFLRKGLQIICILKIKEAKFENQ